MNQEFPHGQAGFRKGRGTTDQIVNICWIIEKAREFQKNIYFCFIDYARAFDGVDHSKQWKILHNALISHASIVMLKIVQARLQQFNHELPDVQAGLRKDRGTRDQIGNIHWIIDKAREFHENI